MGRQLLLLIASFKVSFLINVEQEVIKELDLTHDVSTLILNMLQFFQKTFNQGIVLDLSQLKLKGKDLNFESELILLRMLNKLELALLDPVNQLLKIGLIKANLSRILVHVLSIQHDDLHISRRDSLLDHSLLSLLLCHLVLSPLSNRVVTLFNLMFSNHVCILLILRGLLHPGSTLQRHEVLSNLLLLLLHDMLVDLINLRISHVFIFRLNDLWWRLVHCLHHHFFDGVQSGHRAC